MPITIKNAPAKNFGEFKDNISAYHHKEALADSNDDHHHYIPHKVYNVSAAELASGKKLSEVQQSGWRYLFQDSDGVYHVAEVGMNEEVDDHTFNHVNTGRHVHHFVSLYDHLHNHEHIEEKHYEINILRSSSCYVLAVWLKGEDHEHEFFIPLAPVHERFEAGKTYAYDDFENLLKEVALQMTGVQKQPTADDLTRIEGIGAKSAALLEAAGYTTFKSVAKAQASDLEKVIKAAGAQFNLLDATTWPEQAQLAADGKWKELDELQEELKGGRRE